MKGEYKMVNTFKTSDLYQSAFITHQTKREPDLELQSGRVIFSFPADAPTMEALNQFNRDCEIGAFSFANSIKQMRTNMIHRKGPLVAR
jgi:hypothetical protein